MNESAESNSKQQLEHFLNRVRNAGVALVSKSDRRRLRGRHLRPSLEALDLIPETGELLDIGSGGGFPGIPIAIHRTQLAITLVEANERKAAFLRRVSRETGLNNLEVLNLRVETLDETHANRYDIITARAVAPLTDLLSWTKKLLKPTGYRLLWKGKDWREEADITEYSLKLIEERPLDDGGVLLKLECL